MSQIQPDSTIQPNSTSLMERNRDLPVTSSSLLLRIRDPDDGDSWTRFEDIYGPIIKTFCRRRGIQQADVDDICQEVLVAVANSIRRFDYQPQTGRFRSWLATVTANKLKNHLRQNQRNASVPIDWIEQLETKPEQDSTWNTIFVERIFFIACQSIQDHFEPLTWRCFELAWIQQKAANLVAVELSIPIYSVYVNKSRVLKRLEQEFKVLCEDHPSLNR